MPPHLLCCPTTEARHNRFFPLLALTILVGGLISPVRAGEDSLPPKTLAALKAATVFLKVEAGRESGSGSGFLIKTEGQTAYLVTNNHVIDPSDGQPGRAAGPTTITAIFGSGTKNERPARAEVLAADMRRDLAVLRVQGVRDLPAPVDHDHEPELIETMSVFVLGFPLGELLATGKRNPAITVGKASVSSIRLNDRGDVATVQIAGDITPGNSGGPVVDAQGRLVGIAVATIRNRAIGFAIPATALTRLLNGRLLDYHFTPRPAGAGQLEVQVELSVFDPFGRIKGITFYYLDRDSGGTKKLAGVAGVRKVDLRRSPRQVSGAFTLAGGEGTETPVAFQAVYVNGEGKTILSNPRVRRLRIGGTR
jgi:S1-C subfamily serine protease